MNSQPPNSQHPFTPPPVVKCLVKNVMHSRALKVHLATAEYKPRCGGGRGGKAALAWQEDIGPANCGRCRQLSEQKATKKTKATL